MQDEVRRALMEQRDNIHARWEALLHEHDSKTPLGNPDCLVFMMDWSLNEIFAGLRELPTRRLLSHTNDEPECPCGMNPLLAYYRTAELALVEALERVHAAMPTLSESDKTAGRQLLQAIVAKVRCREVETFCAVCQRRPEGSTRHVCQARAGACIRSR
jgi:hypothetical protein